MKYLFFLLAPLLLSNAGAAQNNGRPDAFQKANNIANKASTVIAIFQPYLLKARQIYYDAKQLAGDVKNSSKATFGNNRNGGTNNPNNNSYPGQGNSGYDSSSYGNQNYGNANNSPGYGSNGNNGSNSNGGYSSNSSNSNNGSYGGNSYPNNNSASNTFPKGSSGTNGYSSNGAGNGYDSQSPQSYLPNQSLPVNNPASINNDGTGNWGNQNNGLYGNCLDALTGTVLGMGEAAQNPGSVDLLFFAPDDGQNTYHIMTPGFARTNGTYMTDHASEQLLSWSEVNETEVALTKLTIGQFEQIQNNSQIQNAVRNAQNYAGYYGSVGTKLDGQVLAVKTQMENREVYALIAVVKQIGTSGNNGYLKIKIKTQGVGANGQINANAYLR